MRRTWEFQASLPEVPDEVLARHITDEPESAVNRLLDKHVYHSLVGGDGSMPGNGAKTAVHLLTAAVESVMRPRFRAHADKLAALIESIEKKIQGEVAETVEINDFERFGRRLDRLKRSHVTAGSVADLLGEEGKAPAIDGEWLSRLSGLLREIKAQRERYVADGSGPGRARMMLVFDAGSASYGQGTYPYNPHPYPWICQLDGDAPALGEGVFVSMAKRLAD
jgi:pyruvate-ferredoxin/flavodoxin oxidoreductase